MTNDTAFPNAILPRNSAGTLLRHSALYVEAESDVGRSTDGTRHRSITRDERPSLRGRCGLEVKGGPARVLSVLLEANFPKLSPDLSSREVWGKVRMRALRALSGNCVRGKIQRKSALSALSGKIPLTNPMSLLARKLGEKRE